MSIADKLFVEDFIYISEKKSKTTSDNPQSYYSKNREKMRDYYREYRKKNNTTLRAYWKKYEKDNQACKKQRENLDDYYVIEQLVRWNGFTKEFLIANPEIIELKRELIKNRRLCKTLKN